MALALSGRSGTGRPTRNLANNRLLFRTHTSGGSRIVKTVSLSTLDPREFTVAQPTAAVDTFEMTNDDGSFVTTIDERFIDRLCANMNAREERTGDLCPLVIGHTPPLGTHIEDEENANPLVGYARNWRKGTLGNTGRPAAIFDPWIFNGDVERVKKVPRRSCEVWVSRCEVDPISLLGSSTPARDLGLMKFNRNGSYTFESPGEMVMPEPKDKEKPTEEKPKTEEKAPAVTEPKGGSTNPEPPPSTKPDPKIPGMPDADPKLTGAAVHDTGMLKQILATLTQLTQAINGGTGIPDPGAGAPAPGAAPAGAEGQDGDLSDEDFEQMLAGDGEGQECCGEGAEGKEPAEPVEEEAEEGAEGNKSRKGEPVVQQSAGGFSGASGGGSNTMVPNLVKKLSAREVALEAENETLRVQLSRRDVTDRLKAIKDKGKDIDVGDEELVSDLIAMEPAMRNRQLDRIDKLSAHTIGRSNTHLLNTALQDPTTQVPGSGPKRPTAEQSQHIVKLAREQGKTYEAIAGQLGYKL